MAISSLHLSDYILVIAERAAVPYCVSSSFQNSGGTHHVGLLDREWCLKPISMALSPWQLIEPITFPTAAWFAAIQPASLVPNFTNK